MKLQLEQRRELRNLHAARCDELLARYRRLVHLAGGHPPGADSYDDLKSKSLAMIADWKDAEAAGMLESQVAAMENMGKEAALARQGSLRRRQESHERFRRTLAQARRIDNSHPLTKEMANLMPMDDSPPSEPKDLAALESIWQKAAANAETLLESLKSIAARSHHAALQESMRSGNAPAPDLAEALEDLRRKNQAHRKDGETEAWLANADALAARLELAGDAEAARELTRKSVHLLCEHDPDRHRLLHETLLLDFAVLHRRAHELAAQREALARLSDRLEAISHPSADALRSELSKALANRDPVDIERLATRTEEAVAAHWRHREREDKRRAVLDSLAELGYQAVEGMQTALAHAGRILVRHPSDQGEYAVEVVANDDLSMIQTSMVRFAEHSGLTEQQRRRDCEREAAWCADHAALRQKLAAQGLATDFKMQLPAGAHPVTVIPRHSETAQRRPISGSHQGREQSG
jgi:hypothetical protein